ncbi:hypothetical protein GCM10009854_39790 [Saccharopolyspora halophila]|uniref:Uncharacterized protein n=1 Tax=Saccharopolyspora halophila TaxID=405551 RepID=A0ABN3GPG0_9PSEU
MTVLVLALRACHWPLFVAASALLAAVNALFGAEQLPVPRPNIGALDVPLGLFSPLVLACLLGLHLSAVTTLWSTGPRNHALVRAGRLTAALLPAVLACAPLLLHGAELWTSATRNTLGLGAMALLVTVAAGPTRCWMLPFPYLLAALLLGTQRSSTAGGSDATWWAFPLQDAGDPRGMLLTAVLLVAGITGYLRFGARAER